MTRHYILWIKLNCKCFGDNKSVVANYIFFTTNGNVKDAELLIYNLVSGDLAKEIVNYTKDYGLGLRLMLNWFQISIISSQPIS